MNARFHSLAGITSLSVAVILALSLSDPLAADEVRDQSTAHERVRFIKGEWTAKEGLPNPIHRLLQTRDGYLWLGTEEGLARFDGVKFTSYRDRSVLANRNLKSQALYETRDGSLWYGTKGGLNLFRDGLFNRFTTSEGLPDNHITALCEDAGGGLWIGTRNGLSRFSAGKFQNFSVQDGLPNNYITSLQLARDGSLWIATDGGLSRYAQARFNTFTRKDGLSDEFIRVIYADRQGRLWIGTRKGGLNLLSDGKFIAFTRAHGLADDSVAGIAEDTDSRLWVATDRGVSCLIKHGFQLQYRFPEGKEDQFNALCADREGGVWAGSDGLMLRFHQAKFTAYGKNEGLPGEKVAVICQTRDGSFWSDIGERGLTRFKNNQVTYYTTRDGLSDETVTTLHETRDGSLWVGTRHGLNRFRDGQFTVLTTRNGLSDDNISVVQEDVSGGLWIGTEGHGLNYYRDGKFTHYDQRNGMVGNRVRSIVCARDGSVWIGTYTEGISRFKNGRFTNYTTTQGLSTTYIRVIFEARDGEIWVGTNGGGVNRFRDERFIAYTVREGLADDQVCHLLEDDSGFLWMTSFQGVSKVGFQQFDELDRGQIKKLSPIVYDGADGISGCFGGSQPGAWKAMDGSLWFPADGLTTIDPNRIRINQLKPPLVIEQIIVDRQEQQLSDQITINPGSRDLEIHYSALSLLAPERVRFKYKLEGYDQDWIEAATRRVVYYTNIPPGRYRFQVIACNNDGIWNETGATLSLDLRPHIYQTKWFAGLCALALAGLAFAGYRWRVRQLRARGRELSARVAERTRDLELEVAEHKRTAGGWQREIAERRQAELKLLSEVAERRRAEAELRELSQRLETRNRELQEFTEKLRRSNQELQDFASIASHDLQEPLRKVQTFGDRLKNKYGHALEETGRDYLERMTQATARMQTLITDLLAYSRVTTKAQPFVPVDLCLIAREVISDLEARIEGTNGKVECDELPVIEADPTQMRQVLQNLIGNALKFHRPDVPPVVQVRSRKLAGENGAEDSWRIEVADNGIGFEEKYLDRIFAIFQRLHGRSEYEGTGIGLAVVRKIIERHGGTITAKSEPGAGSIFILTLPATQQFTESVRSQSA